MTDDLNTTMSFELTLLAIEAESSDGKKLGMIPNSVIQATSIYHTFTIHHKYEAIVKQNYQQ